MAPFTEGIRRRNKEKPVDSALDMLSLRFPCRASWSYPEVYKDLKFKENVQAGGECLEGRDVHHSFTEEFLKCHMTFITSL